MVRRIVFVSVLQRLDTAAASVLHVRLLSATRAFGADFRVTVVGVRLKEGGGGVAGS